MSFRRVHTEGTELRLHRIGSDAHKQSDVKVTSNNNYQENNLTMHDKTKTCTHISSHHVMFGLSPAPLDYDNNRGTKTRFACINVTVRPSHT